MQWYGGQFDIEPGLMTFYYDAPMAAVCANSQCCHLLGTAVIWEHRNGRQNTSGWLTLYYVCIVRMKVTGQVHYVISDTFHLCKFEH